MDPRDIQIKELRWLLGLVLASSAKDLEQIKSIIETVLSMEPPSCDKEECCGSGECHKT
jgi:hypothetical protein